MPFLSWTQGALNPPNQLEGNSSTASELPNWRCRHHPLQTCPAIDSVTLESSRYSYKAVALAPLNAQSRRTFTPLGIAESGC